MLQRAASNAYSWWWASHIRTKQSKWLEQNLQEFEDKVGSTLKLIEEEGDSFARRAQMYYNNRPLLIIFIQESFRSYRALAERFDHLSTELQKANTTIATVFPEQIQFSMDDEEEFLAMKNSKKMPQTGSLNAPKAPAGPVKDLKNMFSSASKKFNPKTANRLPKPSGSSISKVHKSGLSKSDGLDKIDWLQREILVKQTEKEFLKCSYENGVIKFRGIEKQIVEMQQEVFKLQDEFGDGLFIEDDEARALMASSALKSCQEAITNLQKKQAKASKEASIEHEKIGAVRKKVESIKQEFLPDGEKLTSGDDKPPRPVAGKEQKIELATLRAEINEQFSESSHLSVTEMSEKIDDLVNKVLNLETDITGETALILQLKAETDDLQSQIQKFEDEKPNLVKGSMDSIIKIKEMDKKMKIIEEIDRRVVDQSKNLESSFVDSRSNLVNLSQKLSSVRPDEELDAIAAAPIVKEKKSKKSRNEKGERKSKKKKKKGKESTEIITDPSKTENEPEKSLDDSKEPEPEPEPEKSLEDSKEPEPEKSEHNCEIAEKETDESQPETKNSEYSNQDQNQEIEVEKHEPVEITEIKESEESSSQPDPEPAEASENLENSNQTDDPQIELQPKEEPETIEDQLPEKNQDLDLPEHQNQENADEIKEKSPDDNDDDEIYLDIEPGPEPEPEEDDEPDWRELFIDVQKRLLELENKSQDGLFAKTLQLRELKNANSIKDEEIKSLRQKLKDLQAKLDALPNKQDETPEIIHTPKSPIQQEINHDDDEFDIKSLLHSSLHEISETELKFREDIDELLEENLDFWLRFSASFHQIQKFETEIEDLKSDASRIIKEKKGESTNTRTTSLKVEARSIYKHLREIHAELSLWHKTSSSLSEELQSRFASICSIQEEITKALKDSAEEEDFTFTTFQAAKFQGEILNMKQENNKVAGELEAGTEHVSEIQSQVDASLARLDEEFGFSGARSARQLQHCESRNRVPFRNFIFGGKPKKTETATAPSIFSVSPVLLKSYHFRKQA